jgi:hypothetical protein
MSDSDIACMFSDLDWDAVKERASSLKRLLPKKLKRSQFAGVWVALPQQSLLPLSRLSRIERSD